MEDSIKHLEKKFGHDIKKGDKLNCLWKDEKYYACEIIDVRHNNAKRISEFYIHYVDFDRRLDQWVGIDSFSKEDLETKHQNPAASTTSTEKRSDKMRTRGATSLAEPAPHDEHEIKVRNVEKISIGPFEVETWYHSPYPAEYGEQKLLHICHYCLKYMRKKKTALKHKEKCDRTCPPGRKIYEDGNILNDDADEDAFRPENTPEAVAVYEIDGKDAKLYCQNLCLIAKLFLDHKTLFYDVTPFNFYVLTEKQPDGYQIAGYFSKEKHQHYNTNLACIMVLPQYQRRGYGKFLISLSYELSKREDKIGTPERPLSDMGQLSYSSYWKDTILALLRDDLAMSTIKDISQKTAIEEADVKITLDSLKLLSYYKGRYSVNRVNSKVIEEYFAKKLLSKRRSTLAVVFKAVHLDWQPPE